MVIKCFFVGLFSRIFYPTTISRRSHFQVVLHTFTKHLHRFTTVDDVIFQSIECFNFIPKTMKMLELVVLFLSKNVCIPCDIPFFLIYLFVSCIFNLKFYLLKERKKFDGNCWKSWNGVDKSQCLFSSEKKGVSVI